MDKDAHFLQPLQHLNRAVLAIVGIDQMPVDADDPKPAVGGQDPLGMAAPADGCVEERTVNP